MIGIECFIDGFAQVTKWLHLFKARTLHSRQVFVPLRLIFAAMSYNLTSCL